MPDDRAPAAEAGPLASAALSRFTVLDLTRVRAGPTCARQLADWGARVVRVEMPEGTGGDLMGGPREGPDFQNLHRNKRAIALDLKSPEGREVFLRLARRADVVLENFRPGVMRRLGLDWETLSAENPRLILASISGFGQDGPYAERPGFDQIAQGMGGLMSVTGLPGQGPVRAGIPVADLCAGHFAAQGVLVALLEREVSGRGQRVRTSLLQAMVFMMDFQAARWLQAGEVPGQAGNDHPTMIPTGVFPTADGHVNVAASGEAIWARLARALDAPDWLEDPRFSTAAARSENRAALNALIAERTRRETGAALVERLNAAGVPAGPIHRLDEVFADPQVRHLGLAETLDDGRRSATYLAQPFTLSRTPSRIAAHPPEPGEHAEAVLREAGYAAEEIAQLRERGVG